MRATYDKEDDILWITTGQPSADSGSFLRGPDAAVFLGTENGHDIVGLEVLGGSFYLPLGEGYDAESDSLMIGEAVNDPRRVTENGDFVGYRHQDEAGPGDFMDPVGVLVRNASKHLAPVLAQINNASG